MLKRLSTLVAAGAFVALLAPAAWRLPSEHGPPGRRVQARVGAGRRLAPRLPLIG